MKQNINQIGEINEKVDNHNNNVNGGGYYFYGMQQVC